MIIDEKTAMIALSRLKLSLVDKKRIVDLGLDVTALFGGGANRSFDSGLRQAASAFTCFDDIEKDLKKLDKLGARVITIHEAEYPSLLRHIPDAPVVLYAKGPLRVGENTLAIVGSRKAGPEGMNLAEKIGETLSSAGITVASGFARGIDSAAHKGALKGETGGTIAVFGCGIDMCYPGENGRLYGKIAESGLLLTEYGPGSPPLQHHFPERNRIIAGLSKGILVVEASRRSGSLITARLGLEYGREVMAVPGSVFSAEHEGANALIKDGAKLIGSIVDVMNNVFPGYQAPKKTRPVIAADEEKVFSAIGRERVHVDEVIERSAMEAKQVMAILTKLEMKEAIREVAGGFYIRR